MNAAELFESVYRTAATEVWSSPGRVNLIGEHTDYNRGLVLPFAIDARAQVAAALTTDGVVTVVSAQQDSVLRSYRLDELDPAGEAGSGWAAYLFGVVWVLAQRGVEVPGLRLALDSTVPSGAGLSSSAAIECATALAVGSLMDADLSREDIARVAQRAENDFVGVPCGLMDQMASSACTAGHVLFFDVAAESLEQVRFDPAAEGLVVLVADTKVHHSLADGEYAKRRRSCELAAAELGVASLRELTPADLPRMRETVSSDLLFRRARHVVTENARVEQTVKLLRCNHIGQIGSILVASHLSLRDDYEVSDPALDLAVEVAMATGALGARMTGGGFGGSVIALVHGADSGPIGEAIRGAFADRGMIAPVLRTVLPSAGGARDS